MFQKSDIHIGAKIEPSHETTHVPLLCTFACKYLYNGMRFWQLNSRKEAMTLQIPLFTPYLSIRDGTEV